VGVFLDLCPYRNTIRSFSFFIGVLSHSIVFSGTILSEAVLSEPEVVLNKARAVLYNNLRPDILSPPGT